MKKDYILFFVSVLMCAMVFSLTACDDDDDDILGETSEYGKIIGTIELPELAQNEEIWIAVDEVLNDGETLKTTTLTAGIDLEYQYTIDSIPVGIYYLYAGIFMGGDHDTLETGDFFAYCGGGTTPPANPNVDVSAGDSADCTFILQEIP